MKHNTPLRTLRAALGVFVGLTVTWSFVAFSQAATLDDFQARSFKDGAQTMVYRLFVPKPYDKTKKYPLLIFLHGAGETGSDNTAQMSPTLIRLADTVVQGQHPSFVLIPQQPKGTGLWCGCGGWAKGNPPIPENPNWAQKTVLAIVDSLETEFSIDPDRTYLSGLSSGGLGTWDFLCREPGRFAAYIPMSGSGDLSCANKLCDTPVWGLNGHDDNTTKPEPHRKNFLAIETACKTKVVTPLCDLTGNCNAPRPSAADLNKTVETAKHLYSEVPNSAHDWGTWDKILDPTLLKWIFQQKRTGSGPAMPPASLDAGVVGKVDATPVQPPPADALGPKGDKVDAPPSVPPPIVPPPVEVDAKPAPVTPPQAPRLDAAAPSPPDPIVPEKGSAGCAYGGTDPRAAGTAFVRVLLGAAFIVARRRRSHTRVGANLK